MQTCVHLQYLTEFFTQWEVLQTKFVEEIKTRFMFSSLGVFFCCESRTMCDMMWKNSVEPSWNVMAHGDAPEGKWRGNWRVECVASTLHTTSEHGVSSITTADARISAASNRLNLRPCRFKWTRPFRLKTKSSFCARAITFQTQSTARHTTDGCIIRRRKDAICMSDN